MTAQTAIAPIAEKQALPPRRRSLSLKFGLAFIAVVTLVLVVNGAVNIWLSYQEAKSATLRVQREKAQAAAERIDLFVSGIEQQIGWTTRAEWARVPVEQRRYDFIRLLRQAPAITELIHVGGDGKEQLKLSRLEPDAVGSGADYAADPRFTGAISNKIWFGPVTFRRGSEPYMTIAVAHAGRTPGVTIAEVNLKLIWDVVTSIKIGEGGFAFIVDSKGRLVAHPDMSLVLRETDMATLPKIAQDIAGNGAQSNDIAVSTSLDGKSVLVASAPITRLKWFVFVQLPVSEALAPVYTALGQTGALLALGLVLASIVGGLLAKRMVIPIQRLQAGAERLGAGAVDGRIEIRTGDEIETLAGSFNQMAERIRESYATLEAKVEARTHDLNEALQQQTATAEVLKVISRSAFDLQTVLNTLIDTAVRLCVGERGMIALRDGQLLHARAFHSGTPEGLREYLIAHPLNVCRESFSGRAVMTGEVVHIADAFADPEFRMFEMRQKSNYRSILCVPLMRNGEAIGVFTLPKSEAGGFTSSQVELVQTFADQAVIAIENARLFEEVQARTREVTESLEYQTATSEVLGVISRSPNHLQPVLSAILATAARLCEATGGAGAFLLQEGRYHYAIGERVDETDPAFIAHIRANPIDPSEKGSAVARAARLRQPVHVPDSSADPEMKQGLLGMGLRRSVLAVPLLHEGVAVGVILLRRDAAIPFTARQIDLVTTFADQAVIAINNVRLFEQVQARTKELSQSLEELRAAQDRLVQSEKLASLGQLTAGIAHEIKNPLNFINNFSSLSGELLQEVIELLEAAPLDDAVRDEVNELAGMLRGNLEKVVQHGKRADSIVKNMLLHSREGTGDHRIVSVNALVDESVNLAYHGARAERPGFNVTLDKRFDPQAGDADLYPQEITRVLLNLISNGFYATAKRKTEALHAFEPTLLIATEGLRNKVKIRIRDNGTGIPEHVKAKMFNPFFTTKPAGEGTGLGLSLSHDIIVKQHGGTLEVDTELGAFTEFTITLPRKSIADGVQAGVQK